MAMMTMMERIRRGHVVGIPVEPREDYRINTVTIGGGRTADVKFEWVTQADRRTKMEPVEAWADGIHYFFDADGEQIDAIAAAEREYFTDIPSMAGSIADYIDLASYDRKKRRPYNRDLAIRAMEAADHLRRQGGPTAADVSEAIRQVMIILDVGRKGKVAKHLRDGDVIGRLERLQAVVGRLGR